MSAALVGNGNADLVGVEEPIIGTLQANLICPIPCSAAKIRWLSIIRLRKYTFSFLQIVSLIASSAGTSGIMSAALVRNGNTNFFSVENPSIRALEADLIIPVPGSTA